MTAGQFALDDEIGANRLRFTEFPVMGTYAVIHDKVTMIDLTMAVLTALSALGALAAAGAAWYAARETRRGATVGAIGSVFDSMGRHEDIAKARAELRNQLCVRNDQGNLIQIRALSEVNNEADVRRTALRVSASLDRAGFAIMQLGNDATLQLVDLFGDVFVDLWAICFESVRTHQQQRHDDDNRLFFETLAYISLSTLRTLGREPELGRFFDNDSELGNHLLNRLPHLASRRTLRDFVNLITSAHRAIRRKQGAT